jgi:superoxide dismutase, Cu-Zn family
MRLGERAVGGRSPLELTRAWDGTNMKEARRQIRAWSIFGTRSAVVWCGTGAALLGGCAGTELESRQDAAVVQASVAALEICEEVPDGPSAVLRDANGVRIGRVTFTSDGETTRVIVSAQLPAGHGGIHGIHVHANDNPENGEGCAADPAEPASTHFVSADGHFNPGGGAHAHHSGDMPAVLFTAAGEASMRFLTDRFQADEVRGRAVILHASSDNYGNVPVGDDPDQYSANGPEAADLTARTGNGGARIACGVID